ncbi:putative 2OG-Fe(II) oxygenase [Luteimonas terrae]|uniref:Tetratricopeptide (TPR) repeat protein n=1 Tax=Luteimonas terrae TaxID=1530191 RepID=A0ABU1Y1B9_9GAMM|nr:putative 2OG-Fe(II) oxygenase [Luteimonas terrae]MDR7194738.1 tetratricopeptide (TPR) repeat protein [Luteimonas terrae]
MAAWLRRRGRLEDALQLLRSAPATARVERQRGGLHLEYEEWAAARAAFEKSLVLDPRSVEAWHGMANALQGTGALEDADAALQRAIELDPAYAPAWVNRGALLRLLGRIEPALACFQRAVALGHDTPETANAVHGVLQDLGRPADALSGARALIERHPDFVPGHESLAHLLWEYGAMRSRGEDPLGAFRAAALARPGHRPMQLAFVRALVQTQRVDEALAWLHSLRRRAPEDPVLDWLTADAMDRLGHDGASALFAAAHRHLGNRSTEFLNAHARHAFRTGRMELARDCAQRALRLDPANQEAWGHLGIAWRLAGDAREHWLFDYARLIADLEIETPPGYADLAAFLSALRVTLDTLHLTAGQPMGQSVRNGSQTPGRLFGRDDAVLRAAESSLRASAEDWLAGLPHDPRHPFLRIQQRRVRIVGAWSVRLNASGRHANHIHNEGWMSSAFYVALPPSVCAPARPSTAGCLQFGQPMDELALDLPPRRIVHPKPGRLALFPSYMWHGTVPFDDSAPRLTIAFDIQPAS